MLIFKFIPHPDPTNTKAIHLTSTRNQLSVNEIASESGTFLIPILALGALMTVGLCTLPGVVFCCMLKLILRRRKGKEGVAVTASSKEEHYEVIDPIYKVINTDTDHLSSGTQIKMDNNDAYTTIKFVGKTSLSYSSEGLDDANNEAYMQISPEIDVLPMEHNSSYQATPFNFIFSVAPPRVAITRTQECYDEQSVYNLKQIQQKKSCIDTPMSQNDKIITEFQNQDPVLCTCVKGVDMNINSLTQVSDSSIIS